MRVVHILKGDPFSWKAHEALRLATATAISNETFFVCVRDGVYVLTDWKPEELGIESFDKFWETAELVNLTIVAEEESLHDRGIIKTELKAPGVQVKSSEEIRKLIETADAVFLW